MIVAVPAPPVPATDMSGLLPKAGNLADVADAGASRANLHVPALAGVRVVATSNISLNGTATIDGVALAVGDRVLAAAQTTASQNGVWVVASGSWTRPTDFPAAGSVKARSVLVNEGSAGAGQTWRMLASSNLTIDTSAQSWSRDLSLLALENGIAPPNTMLIVGPSQDANNGALGADPTVTSGGGYNKVVSARGPMAWANILLGQRLKIVANKAVSGTTSGEILNGRTGGSPTPSLDQLLAAYKGVGWVACFGGPGNDMLSATSGVNVNGGASYDGAQVWVNMKAIIDKVIASGARFMTTPVWPYGQGAAPTSAMRQAVADYDRLLRAYARVKPGLVIANLPRPLIDPIGGDWYGGVTTNTADRIHVSVLGAYETGKEIARVLDPLVPPVDRLPSDGNNPNNLLGTKGFFAGTLGNGNVPTGWTKSGANASINTIAAPDGVGQAAQISVDSGTDQQIQFYCALPAGARDSGRDISAMCAIKIDAAVNIKNLGLYAQPTGGSPTANTASLDTSGSDASGTPFPSALWQGALGTADIQIPAGSGHTAGFFGIKLRADAGTKITVWRAGLFAPASA